MSSVETMRICSDPPGSPSSDSRSRRWASSSTPAPRTLPSLAARGRPRGLGSVGRVHIPELAFRRVGPRRRSMTPIAAAPSFTVLHIGDGILGDWLPTRPRGPRSPASDSRPAREHRAAARIKAREGRHLRRVCQGETAPCHPRSRTAVRRPPDGRGLDSRWACRRNRRPLSGPLSQPLVGYSMRCCSAMSPGSLAYDLGILDQRSGPSMRPVPESGRFTRRPRPRAGLTPPRSRPRRVGVRLLEPSP